MVAEAALVCYSHHQIRSRNSQGLWLTTLQPRRITHHRPLIQLRLLSNRHRRPIRAAIMRSADSRPRSALVKTSSRASSFYLIIKIVVGSLLLCMCINRGTICKRRETGNWTRVTPSKCKGQKNNSQCPLT